MAIPDHPSAVARHVTADDAAELAIAYKSYLDAYGHTFKDLNARIVWAHVLLEAQEKTGATLVRPKLIHQAIQSAQNQLALFSTRRRSAEQVIIIEAARKSYLAHYGAL